MKNYLRDPELKRTGSFLTALAFGAEQGSVPLKVTAKEKELDKAEQYRSLLHCKGEQLLDLLVNLDEELARKTAGDCKIASNISASSCRIHTVYRRSRDFGEKGY